MFALKQPRIDPVDHVPSLAHHPHGGKGPLSVTSSRSLRVVHTTSLRSAAFLLSLRVPDRDPERAVCCICEDGDSVEDNPIMCCDGPCSLAYHSRCLNLKVLPKENEEWCCSDICRKAKQRGVSVENEVVVRLVQQRRDEYDERGPYDEQGTEGNAELQELFASLDSSYFCPRMMWKLWKKGKWRLQDVDENHRLDIMQLIGGISEPGWDLEREEHTDLEEKREEENLPQPTALSDPSSVAMMIDGGEADTQPVSVQAQKLQQPMENAEAVFTPVLIHSTGDVSVPQTGEICKADAKPISRSQSCPAAFFLPSSVPSLDGTFQPPVLSPKLSTVTHSSSHPPLSLPPLLHPSSLPLPSDSDDSPLLSEESRLLTAYSAQLLANNQTKAKLLAAFHSHRINPASLPHITEKQRQEEDIIRTYLEYEEKMDIGTEKDRGRKAERIHVNYCTCSHCFNKHLGGQSEEEEEEGDADLTYEEEGEGEGEEEEEVKADEPTTSSSTFSLPPAPPALHGLIDPAALLRYVTVSLRRREKALALAKEVGGPELTQLLLAGKAGRTLTRGQMKKQKEDDDTPSEPTHHTRRRSTARQMEDRSSSPTEGGRRNAEMKSLLPWGWDRSWQKQDVTASLHQQSAVLPRGRKRLRVMRDGIDVFNGSGLWTVDRLPVVKVRALRNGKKSSLTLTIKRQDDQLLVKDEKENNEEKMRRGRRQTPRNGKAMHHVKLLFEGDEMNRFQVNDKVIGRLRMGRTEQKAQPAVDLTSAATALATEMVQQLMGEGTKKEMTDHFSFHGEEEEDAEMTNNDHQQPMSREEYQQAVKMAQYAREKERKRQKREHAKLLKEREKLRREARKAEQRAAALAKVAQQGDMIELHLQVNEEGIVHISVTVKVDYPWGRGARKIEQIETLDKTDLTDADTRPTELAAATVTPMRRKRGADIEHLKSVDLTNPNSFTALPILVSQESGEPPGATERMADAEGKQEGEPTERPRRSMRARRSTAGTSEVEASPGKVEIDSAALPDGDQMFVPPASVASQYPLDFNGLPIITNPIDEGICIKCGETGDIMLCDGTVDGIPCIRCWHLSCTELSKVPNNKFFCSYHRCNTCHEKGKRTRDHFPIHQPFTYCEWCDRSWCKDCAPAVMAAGEAVEWTPKQSSALARYVCCKECIEYFQTTFGKDFRDPQRQLAAHKEKVMEQLKLQAKAKDEQSLEAGEETDSANSAPEDERVRGGKQKTQKRKQRSAKRQKVQEGVQSRRSDVLNGNAIPELTERRRGWPKGKLRGPRSSWGLKLDNGNGKQKDEEQDQEDQKEENEKPNVKRLNDEEMNGPSHTNGIHPSISTEEIESLTDSPAAPPLHTLQPCIVRSQISTAHSNRRLSARKSLNNPFEFASDEQKMTGEAAVNSEWSVDSNNNQQIMKFRRRNGRSVDTSTSLSSTEAGRVSPISLPSPSTPSSLPCLSTSSTLSTPSLPSSISPSPSTPTPPPPPPSSLDLSMAPSLVDIPRVIVRSGEKRTRSARRVEMEGDAQLAKKVQDQLDREERGLTPKKLKMKR